MSQAAAERALVDLARSGDQAAFETIVRSRMDAVYRLSLAILADESDAADAAQEAFVAAWRGVPELREVDRFEAWLRRIVVNACRAALRARRRRRVREIPAAALADLDRASGSAGSAATDDPAGDAEMLRFALRRLDPDQRAILALHHLEGRPILEIGAILGIREGTVKSRLFHARAALQKALREEAGR